MTLRLWRAPIAAIGLAPLALSAIGGQTVSVRGVAYDSLRGTPLRNAIITVAGNAARATTDDLGQFTIGGLPVGTHTFNAQHATLDSIGLSGIATRVVVTHDPVVIRLGIPSFATFWRTACGATPVPRDRGFIYGTVRDARDLTPSVNAAVDVRWLELQVSKGSGISQRPWRGQARTDSTGSYGICGIPLADGLRMQALADSGISGIVNVFPSPLRMQRRDLLLGPATDTDQTRRAAITGRVTDESGAPFPDARVFINEYGEVRSGADGTVRLPNVPAGTRQVEVLAIGRIAVSLTMELAAGDTGSFVAALRRITTLDVVRITGTRRQRKLMEDFERRRITASGLVLDSTDLAQRGRLASAFESLPSVEVRSRGGQFSLTLPAGNATRCTPVVFIDGRKTDLDELNSFRIGELAAIELFPRRMSTPAEFIGNEACGAVVVWTRWAFR